MEGVVFKQSYKSANLNNTPMLNRKHLNYIAIRPGAIHNPGCGFGLFGKLVSYAQPGNIDSLTTAKKIITDVSKRKTIYRAILSLDHAAALKHGYYDRDKWENLIHENMKTIAKEMHIRPSDLRYAASFHCEKGHPHVHVMYWDNSRRIQNECIPRERFEHIAQNVRTAFSRAVFHDELTHLRNEKRADMENTQLELRALCRECNAYDVLNLRRMKKTQINDIGAQLLRLAANLPKTGRLIYGFMPLWYKQQLNDCIDAIFALPTFHKIRNKLQALDAQIYQFSGYGQKSGQWHTEKDEQNFYKTMGNELLRYMKEHQAEWQNIALSTTAETGGLTTALRGILATDATLQADYQAVRNSMPAQRTPFKCMPDEFKPSFETLMRNLLNHPDIAIRISALAREQQKQQPDEKLSSLRWKLLENILSQTLYEDAGYMQQEQSDMTLDFLSSFFRLASQESNHQQAALQQQHTAFQDLSQTAKKDLQQRLSQQSNWDLEI